MDENAPPPTSDDLILQEQAERVRLGGQLLQKRLSVIPFYAEKANREDGGKAFFEAMYGSAINLPLDKI